MTLRQAMISWLQDAFGFYVDHTWGTFTGHSTSDLMALIRDHYEGGMAQFLADSPDIVSQP